MSCSSWADDGVDAYEVMVLSIKAFTAYLSAPRLLLLLLSGKKYHYYINVCSFWADDGVDAYEVMV